MESKICTKCNTNLDANCFYKSHKNTDGLNAWCKLCSSGYGREYYGRIKDAVNENSRNYRHQLRKEALDAYGGKCVCCGETEICFLAFDHINGGGRKHRQETSHGMGNRLYLWLKTNNYPKDVYQLLCHNCNMAKGFYGQCPHKRGEKV